MNMCMYNDRGLMLLSAQPTCLLTRAPARRGGPSHLYALACHLHGATTTLVVGRGAHGVERGGSVRRRQLFLSDSEKTCDLPGMYVKLDLALPLRPASMSIAVLQVVREAV